MPSRTKPIVVPDAYYELVKKFPLVPIRDDDHLAQACAAIDGLLRRNLDEGESAYLDVLSDLVHRYEQEHHPLPSVSPAGMLRYLLQENDVSQAQLARAAGIPTSVIADVLLGTRKLSKTNIKVLANYFGVSPTVFLRQD